MSADDTVRDAETIRNTWDDDEPADRAHEVIVTQGPTRHYCIVCGAYTEGPNAPRLPCLGAPE